VLLTGDRRAAADAAARDLGLADVQAELLPHQKAAVVERLKREHGHVGMLGDGINDAPALAKADVGLAISGVDLAAEAGDIILMGDPLRPLPMLVRLSRKTLAIIEQNILWFAFGVNAVGIVVTAWLWPLFAPSDWVERSPLVAVLYHQVGSLAVLLNSMRLVWFERTGTSPGWARWTGRARDFDLWLERTFDVHEWAHWLYERRRKVRWSLLIAGLAVWGVTGLSIVRPEEWAVARRFGAYADTLEPGWHWRWPAPIEQVTRVSQRMRTLEVGFREVPEELGKPGSWTWTSAHRKENRRPEESLMITGDGNLADIQVVVHYRVVEPRVYLFDVANAEDVLRATTESVLRALIAGRPFQQLLTVQRAQFRDDVLARLRRTCESYGAAGLGVELQDVSLIDLHPPAEVVDAYYQVATAMEGRDRRINEAQTEATKKLKDADAEAERLRAEARASAVSKVLEARAETSRFLELSATRKSTSGDAALTDFRIFWETVARALTGREMVLVDSDQVRGQRNLLLVDPALLRPTFPIMLPPDNELRSPGR
jgi:Cu+-exporting ATPase